MTHKRKTGLIATQLWGCLMPRRLMGIFFGCLFGTEPLLVALSSRWSWALELVRGGFTMLYGLGFATLLAGGLTALYVTTLHRVRRRHFEQALGAVGLTGQPGRLLLRIRRPTVDSINAHSLAVWLDDLCLVARQLELEPLDQPQQLTPAEERGLRVLQVSGSGRIKTTLLATGLGLALVIVRWQRVLDPKSP